MALTDVTRKLASRQHDWPEALGVFGLYLFAFFAYLGTAPATVGTVLFSLAFAVRASDWQRLASERLIQLCLVYAAYVLVHSLYFYLSAPTPAFAADVAHDGGNWVKLLLFIPFAYWAGGNGQRVRLLLFLTLIGFTLNIFRTIDWASFDAGFFSTRFGANLPANAFGMLTGIAVLGLAALRGRFWQRPGAVGRRWLLILLWALLFVILAEGLVLSLSRGSWLAFAAAAVLLLLAEWRSAGRRKGEGDAKRVIAGGALASAALFVLVFGGLVALNAASIAQRIADVTGTVEQVTQGNLRPAPTDAAALRLQAWQLGLEKWAKQPWFGWGAGSSNYLLAHSGRPVLRDAGGWMDHLHNTYLEILVQLGAVGFVLLFLVLWLLLAGNMRACRQHRLASDLCRFFAAVFVFVLVWNLFEYRVVRHDWSFFWILFAGSAYSFHLRGFLGREPAARDTDPGRAS